MTYIPCEYAVEVTNRFKGLELVSIVPEELWAKVCTIVQDATNKTIPKENKTAKWLSEEALQKAKERREPKRKGEREKYIQLNADLQRTAQREKKAFFNEQCIKLEENNRSGNTRALFRKIGDIKGTFCPKMGTIKA